MNSYESTHLASYANKFSGLSQPLFAKSPDCNSLVHDADSRSPMSPIDKSGTPPGLLQTACAFF